MIRFFLLKQRACVVPFEIKYDSESIRSPLHRNGVIKLQPKHSNRLIEKKTKTQSILFFYRVQNRICTVYSWYYHWKWHTKQWQSEQKQLPISTRFRFLILLLSFDQRIHTYISIFINFFNAFFYSRKTSIIITSILQVFWTFSLENLQVLCEYLRAKKHTWMLISLIWNACFMRIHSKIVIQNVNFKFEMEVLKKLVVEQLNTCEFFYSTFRMWILSTSLLWFIRFK